MGYSKAIFSGDLIEKYEYEYGPPVRNVKKPGRGKIAPRLVSTQKEREANLERRRASSIIRSRQSFHRLVRTNLQKGKPYLLTLTMLQVVDLAAAYGIYHEFTQRFRRVIGKDSAWIAVPEFQKRGAVHFHILIWDLPYELGKTERDTRRIQNLWREGYVDCIPTNGSPRLASYLGKYMSKAMQDPRLLGKRAYSATRNVLRPVSLNTKTSIDAASEAWGLTRDTLPTIKREYDAKWMGKCVYTAYSVVGKDISDNIRP